MTDNPDNKFKSTLAKLASEKILAWLAVEAKFFTWGPIGLITRIIVQSVLTKAIELTFFGAMIGYIFVDTERDLNAVEKILVDIRKRKGSLTPDEIKAYDKKLADAGRELIQFGTI